MKKFEYYRINSPYRIGLGLLETWGNNGWELCSVSKRKIGWKLFGTYKWFETQWEYDYIFKKEKL